MTEHKLIAYVGDTPTFDLVAAPPSREWMNPTWKRSAYKCLPMLIANQSGWMILNPTPVRCRWSGQPGVDAVTIEEWVTDPNGSPGRYGLISNFGSGIVTFVLPYLFRTSEGYNLHVRGPANNPKDGVCALEGIVETDWTPATFTMNWQITRAETWVTFDRNEPICMISPLRRGELEQFTPEIRSIDSDPELKSANEQWKRGRDKFKEELHNGGTWTPGWEKTYFKSDVDGHQTKLHLKPFLGSTSIR